MKEEISCSLLEMEAAAAARRLGVLLCDCEAGSWCSSGPLLVALTGPFWRIRSSGTMHGSSSRSMLSDSDFRLSGTSGMQGSSASLWK